MAKQSYNWFSLSYCIYLVFAILNPAITIGGISVRHILSIIMIVLCYNHGSKRIDWFIILYSVFIIFYLYAGYLTGFLNESFTFLFSTYLVAIILYGATRIMVVKFGNIKLISILLLVVFIIDAIVTIGQYFAIPIFTIIPQLLGLKMENYLERADTNTIMVEQNMFGLVGAVLNGYILSAATILAWYPYKKHTTVKTVIIVTICMLACFFTQERSGFYIALILFIYIVFTKFRSTKGLNRIFIGILIVLLIVYGGSLYNIIMSSGRYASRGMDDGGRMDYFQEFLTFIQDNPMGGIDLYRNTHIDIPHNVIANVFVNGGLIGGTCLLIIIIVQCIMIGKFMFTADKRSYWLPLLFGLMYLDFTGNSFVHNQSLAYGTPLFFVFWGVFSCYVGRKDANKQRSGQLLISDSI